MPAHCAWKFRLIKAAIASSLSAAVMPPWLRRFLAITFFTGTAAGAAALLLIAFGAVAWAAALPLAAFGAAALAADAFPLPAETFFLVCVLVAAVADGPPLAAWGASSFTGALPSVKGLRADFSCRGIGICSSAPEGVMLALGARCGPLPARPVRAACSGWCRVLACVEGGEKTRALRADQERPGKPGADIGEFVIRGYEADGTSTREYSPVCRRVSLPCFISQGEGIARSRLG